MPDGILRAVTDDGSFRVIAAHSTRAIQAIVRAQGARGPLARCVAELTTGTALIRQAMAPELRMQGILKPGRGRGSLVCDTHPGGRNRGLVQLASRSGDDLAAALVAPGALLQVMRSLPNGALHQGVVEVPEDGGISGALMTYMQESEQVVSMISVATEIEDDVVRWAAGYLVELLPDAHRGAMMVMTERLADFASQADFLRRHGGSPDDLLGELLYGMPLGQLEREPLTFSCDCSETRLIASLATLPRSDILSLAESEEALEIRCEYCGREYSLVPERLRPLLVES